MAEQLGRAELVLELNDKALRQGLEDLKRDIANVSASINPRSTGSGRSGGGRGVATPAEVDRLTQLARELNLNTNWGKALAALQDVDTDLRLIAAGTEFNVNESWRAALAKLDEIDSDLKLISAGDQLNLNTSWGNALQALTEVQTDLNAIDAAQKLNLASSWAVALDQLQEVKSDLAFVASAETLNLRTSWGKFLDQLEGVKADIDAATRDAANSATRRQIRARIQQNRQELGGFGAASRDNFGSTPATVRDIFDDDLARVRAARVRQEQTAADITRLTAQSERRAAKAFAAASAARTRRLTEAASNAVIGGAFPALFGQGAGASLGGGLGGGLGGLIGGQFGFGLSLVGTAIGQRFDEINRALQDPIQNFDALKTAGLLSSSAVEKNVEALIKQGRAAEANAIIQRELGERFGSQQEAQSFNEAIKGINSAFSEAAFVLGKFVAGPLADFLKRLREQGNPNSGNPSLGLNGAQNRERLTNNSNALINTGTGFAAAGFALAPTGVGAPVALGLLGTGAVLAGVGAATRPGAPSATGTQANMDRELAVIAQQRQTEEIINELRQARLSLVTAEIQGQDDLVLRLKRSVIELEKQKALSDSVARGASPIERQGIADQFNLQLQRVDEQELLALSKKRAEEEQKILDRRLRRGVANLELQGIEASISAARDLATLEGTALVRLQGRLKIEESLRKERAAQLQLQRELAKPIGDGRNGLTRTQESVDKLIIEQEKANANVRLAYAEAGASLARNAKAAADSLRSAQDNLQSVLRSGFDFLSPALQRQQLAQARAAVDPLIARGIIRSNIDISTPERLLQVANFADSFTKAENDLNTALDENTKAQQALAKKDWTVVVNVPGGSASGDVVREGVYQ